MSGGSRLAEDAARAIRSGHEDAAPFTPIVGAPGSAADLPELILVGRADGTDLVVLEGHVRLTSYLLEPAMVPEYLPVIVGKSARIGEWRLY